MTITDAADQARNYFLRPAIGIPDTPIDAPRHGVVPTCWHILIAGSWSCRSRSSVSSVTRPTA
ncbi:MAG: hypothetical protein R2710_31110 [Acidimicrobiales bacterium]